MMRNTTSVQKFKPFSSWQVRKIESWLEQLSEEGLHLEHVGFVFAKFTKSAAKKTKYLIRVTDGTLTGEEKEELYAQGWRYVDSYGNYFHVLVSDSPTATLTMSSRYEQVEKLVAIRKKMRNGMLATIAMNILLAGSMTYKLFALKKYGILETIDSTAQMVLMMVIAVVAAVKQGRDMRRANRLQHDYEMGSIERDRFEDGELTKKTLSRIVIPLILNGLLMAMPLYMIWASDTEVADLEEAGLAPIHLTDTEVNPRLIQEFEAGGARIITDQSYTQTRNSLVSTQYTLWERVTFKKVVLHGKLYTPSINSNLYVLSVDSLGRQVLEDLVDRYIGAEGRSQMIERTLPGFDRLLVSEDEVRKQIFGQSGNKVLHIRYYGDADLDHLLELVSNSISNEEM